MLRVILLLIFCAAAWSYFVQETIDKIQYLDKDLIDSLYGYIFENATYFIYHNSSAVMPTKPLVLMELFVTPLWPQMPHRFATFVVRIVRLFFPQTKQPFATIIHQLAENFCCLKPFANITLTFGFTTNIQTSGQFGWLG